MNEDVSPTRNADFPAIAMLVNSGVSSVMSNFRRGYLLRDELFTFRVGSIG